MKDDSGPACHSTVLLRRHISRPGESPSLEYAGQLSPGVELFSCPVLLPAPERGSSGRLGLALEDFMAAGLLLSWGTLCCCTPGPEASIE